MDKLALIIPTYQRSELLRTTLESLARGTVHPDQVVVVDGSETPAPPDQQGLNGLSVDYLHVQPPGLTRQRNRGVACLRKEITLAGYLDDDIEMSPHGVEAMLRFWSEAGSEVGGASFFIANQPESRAGWLFRLFGISGHLPGKVLPSGFVTAAVPEGFTVETEWLCGGATVWRRGILERFDYDEWFEGAAYFEDIDFSHRVSREYRLFVVGSATLDHNPPEAPPEKGRRRGEMEILNRHYFVTKCLGRRFPWFWLSTFGLMVASAVSTLSGNAYNRHRLGGQWSGLRKLLLG